jgi:plastocyanin
VVQVLWTGQQSAGAEVPSPDIPKEYNENGANCDNLSEVGLTILCKRETMRTQLAMLAIFQLAGMVFIAGACASHEPLPQALSTAFAPAPAVMETPAPRPTEEFKATSNTMPMPIPAANHTSPSTPMSIPVPAQNEVWIVGSNYRPIDIHVPVGTTVTWIGMDNDAHDVESDTGLFFTNLPAGATFSYLFTERGVFRYHCGCNPGMEGSVIVE